MKKIIHYFETDQGKFAKNAIVCGGAAVVLAGALFKLMHWPGASIMLIVGMGTEVLLFAFFAILPPHKDYYWEKIYPGIDINPDLEHGEEGQAHLGDAVEQINKGLEQTEVSPEIIEKLGSNLKKMGEHLARISDMTDASSATDQYATNAQAAAEALSEMKGAYSRATEAAGELAEASAGASDYRDQMTKAATNLGSLNELYELQIQDNKSMADVFSSMNDVMTNLQSAAEDTKRYKEEVSELAKNISSLNSVYGNMLSAMSGASNG